MQPDKVFFVLPTFNDFTQLSALSQAITQQGFNCVIVEDGSCIDFQGFTELKKLYYLRHEENLGQGAALQTGFEFSILMGADIIVSFDADGQHQLIDALEMINLLRVSGVDVILGSRFLHKPSSLHIPKTRVYLLKLARFFSNLLIGLSLSDAHNGLRVFNKEAINMLRIKQNRMAHATEIICLIKKYNLRYKEHQTYITYSQEHHKSKSLWYIIQIIWDLLYMRIYQSNYALESVFLSLGFIYNLLYFNFKIYIGVFNFVVILIFLQAIIYRNHKTRLFQKTLAIRKKAIQHMKKL